MSMVHTDIPGARVLDLFSGSGALGLEALSRGAASVDFLENDPTAFRVLRLNIELLGAEQRCVVHRENALKYLSMVPGGSPERPAYDMAFADPPYRKQIAVELANRWLKRPFATIFGVEHESSESMPAGGDTRRYGDTSVTIFRT